MGTSACPSIDQWPRCLSIAPRAFSISLCRHALAPPTKFVFLLRALTAEVLLASPEGEGVDGAIDAWAGANAALVERCMSMLADVRASRTYDLTGLSVALREARNLVHSRA